MIESYLSLFRDEIRIGAFRRAIMQTVRQGDVVVDLGTGVGTFAVFACQAGAKRVYAIEQTNAIEAAKELATANGMADRITFLKDDSLMASLPEKADILITEAFWSLFASREFERTLLDARGRFLKPRGRVIPEEVTLLAAPAEAAALYEKASLRTGGRGEPLYGINVEPLAKLSLNSFFSGSLDRSGLLAEAAPLAKIKLKGVRSLSMNGSSVFPVKRKGAWHFTALWFQMKLCPDVILDTAPGSPPLAWEHVLLPLEKPLSIAGGDHLTFNLKTSLFRDDFLWSWSYGVQGVPGKSGLQSTFFSAPLSKTEVDFIFSRARPRLSAWGEAAQYILGCADGQNDILTIAQMAKSRFSGLFDSEAKSLAAVRELLRWGCD